MWGFLSDVEVCPLLAEISGIVRGLRDNEHIL